MKTRKSFAAILIAVVLVAVLGVVALTACTPEHEHNYSAVGSDENNHWNYCPDDNEIQPDSTKAHVDADRNGKCDVCEHEVAVEPADTHVHEYTKWDGDATRHWQVCLTEGAINDQSRGVHCDEDSDGYCDVCEYEMGISVTPNVKVEEIEGVPTLVVVGNIPTDKDVEITCVRLHVEGNGTHKWFAPSETESTKWTYKIYMPLTELSIEGTPWWYMHIDGYEEEPAAGEESRTSSRDNLILGELSYAQSIDYNDIRYTVIHPGHEGQLVIQPTYIAKYSVTSIEFADEKYLVVKGTKSDSIAALMVHAWADGDKYGELATLDGNNFTAKFDITQIPLENTPWAWFHIWTYENTPDSSNWGEGKTQIDIAINGLIEVGSRIEYEGCYYTVISGNDADQLVLQRTLAPKFEVSNATIDPTDGLKLIVTGTKADSVATVMVHSWSGGHVYGTKTTLDGNNFVTEMDLTQLKVGETAYMHINTYENDVTDGDYTQGGTENNIPFGSHFENGAHIDYNGVRYTINNDNGSIVILVSEVPTEDAQ